MKKTKFILAPLMIVTPMVTVVACGQNKNTTIKTGDFYNNLKLTYTGTNGSGILNISGAATPDNSYIIYWVNDNKYYSTPKTLSNGDKVKIQLFANEGFNLDDTDKYFETVVSGLSNSVDPIVKTEIDVTQFLSGLDVSWAGKIGSATISPQKKAPDGSEYIYSIDGGSTWNNTSSSLNLQNGDAVQVGIKLIDNANYELVNETTKTFNVEGLTNDVVVIEYDAQTYLSQISNKVAYSGTDGSGTLRMSATIPSDLELLFSTNGANGTYSSIIPSGLSNGDYINVKLKVRDGVQDVVLLNPTVTTPLNVVSGLTPPVVITNYDARTILDSSTSKVSYSGNDGSGTLRMSATIPSELELLFSTSGTYSTTVPTSLSNGDIVSIKLKVKDGVQNVVLDNSTYSAKLTTVSGLTPQVVVTNYDAETVLDQITNQVSYSGTNGSGTLTITKTIPSELEFLYSTTTYNGTYSTTVPTTLSNGDRVYVRVKVKDGVQNVVLDNADFSPSLTTVSGLTVQSVVFDTIDRNSTINNIGTGSYTVVINTANVPAGLTINTNLYETDMFIYQIHDELKMDNTLVTESDIHGFIRKFEEAVPYGAGMYNTLDRDAAVKYGYSYAQVKKPTFAIIGFDSSQASSTSGASTDVVEVKISSAFRGPLSNFSTVALHEWAHNDGHVSNIMLKQYFQSEALYTDWKASWRANSELLPYDTYFDANWDSVNNPAGLQDTTANIDTPWGVIPSGSDRFNDNMDPYIFNNNEMIARMLEVYASNYDNNEYLTSSIVQTTASLYEEFGSAPYDSDSTSQAVVDLLKDDIYAFDTYGGHVNAIAHLVNDSSHIVSADFALKFGGAYDLSADSFGYGDYFQEVFGDRDGPSTANWNYATFDVDYKPTSFLFNPILADGVYDEVIDGRLYYADVDKMSTQNYALIKVWEFTALAYHLAGTNPDMIQWELTTKDAAGNVVNVYESTDHTPW